MLDLELLNLSLSNTVESKFVLNFQKETGFGQLSGCFLPMKNMVIGQLLEKSILLNQEVMMFPVKPVVSIPSVLLSIGVQDGQWTVWIKPMLFTSIHQVL